MERLVQVRACPWAKTDEGGGERHVPAERLDLYPTFQPSNSRFHKSSKKECKGTQVDGQGC